MSIKVIMISAYLSGIIVHLIGGAYKDGVEYFKMITEEELERTITSPNDELRFRRFMGNAGFILITLMVVLWPITYIYGTWLWLSIKKKKKK